MSVDPVSASQTLWAQPDAGGVAATPAEPDSSFATWLGDQIARTSAAAGEADRQLALLASGQAPSLHQVMIALEEARLSLQLLVQVRNRLLDAYQEISRMQI
jgi:flagellar hook-basal body complex protein FliE